jgi:transcriptional regulator with XRE-family HTH domain
MTEPVNNLKAFLIGGDGALDFAPDGLLALRKMSVEQLARASKVTRTAVYNYINGINRPTTLVLRRLCENLQVPFELGLEYCSPASSGRPPAKSA